MHENKRKQYCGVLVGIEERGVADWFERYLELNMNEYN